MRKEGLEPSGLGLALMMIISVAGDAPEIGVGVGGAVAIVGAAFLVRALVVRSFGSQPPSMPSPPPASL